MKINHLNILESTSLPPQASVLLRILDPRFHSLTSVWITAQQFMLGFCLHLVFKVGIRRTARNNQELLRRHATEISKRDHKGTKKKKSFLHITHFYPGNYEPVTRIWIQLAQNRSPSPNLERAGRSTWSYSYHPHKDHNNTDPPILGAISEWFRWLLP